MELIRVEHKEQKKAGRTYHTVDRYRIGHYTVTKYSGDDISDICVTASYEDRTDNYIPDICYDDGYFGTAGPRFTIQTTAYGAKSPDEIQKVIEGYQEALEVVRVLTEAFC